MASDFISIPSDSVTVADSVLIYQLETDSTITDDFRFVVKMYEDSISSANLMNTFYISPNTNDYAFFNLGEAVRGLLAVDDRTYNGTGVLHSYSSKYFNKSNGNIRKFVIVPGEWNGSTETMKASGEYIHLIDGHFQISQGFDPSFNDYYGTASTKKFWLTDREPILNTITINAAEEDEGVIAFINTDTVSDVEQFTITVYNEAGTFLDNETFLINTTNGAELPSSSDVDGFLCYLGIYPANIDAVNSILTNNPTWNYYTVIPQLTAFAIQKGNAFRVNKDCRPVKHSPVQLAWANTVGGWDYLRFDGKKQKTVTREEKSYRKIVGDYDASSFSFTSFDRETQPYHVEAKEQYVLNGILTIEELTLFQYCMRSKNVMARIDGSWVPVIVQTNSMRIEEETTSKIFLTTFNVELAQYIRC